MKEPIQDLSAPTIHTRADESRLKRRDFFFRYGLALFYSVGGILMLQWVRDYFPGNEPPLILLALCVTAAAWYGGFGPGFLTTILIALGAWGFLIPPPGFAPPHFLQTVRLVLIVAAGTSVSALAEIMLRSMRLLRQNERRLRIVLDNAGLGIMECDPDDRIILANKYILNRLDYPLQDLLGKPLWDLKPPAERAEARALLGKLHKRRLAVGNFETHLTRRDGSIIPVHATLAPVRDADGWFLGLIVTLEDITERKRGEAEREQAKEDLARSNRDLEQFANVVSHDLKEPLRMVEAFGGLLKDRHSEKLDGESREYLDFIIAGVNRMSMLIKGLLDYSRVDRGVFVRSAIDMNRVVEDVLGNLRVAMEANHATIHVDPMPVVCGNPTQLVQLFQNLIENALKYRKAEIAPEVRISSEREDDHWLFRVQDNGLGVNPQYHARIFELFQRLHPAEAYSGIGMGLAVCKKIVERHGGRIWVESTPDQGAAFLFTLPGHGTGREGTA